MTHLSYNLPAPNSAGFYARIVAAAELRLLEDNDPNRFPKAFDISLAQLLPGRSRRGGLRDYVELVMTDSLKGIVNCKQGGSHENRCCWANRRSGHVCC